MFYEMASFIRCTHYLLLAGVVLCLFIARGYGDRRQLERHNLLDTGNGAKQVASSVLPDSKANQQALFGQDALSVAKNLLSPLTRRRRKRHSDHDETSSSSPVPTHFPSGTDGTPTPPSRKAARANARAAALHRQDLKKRLLRMFGFKKEPLGMKDRVIKPRVPQFMLDAFKYLDTNEYLAREMRVCFDKDKEPPTDEGQKFRFRVKFGLNKVESHKVVLHHAELQLFRKANYTKSASMENMVISWLKKLPNGKTKQIRHNTSLTGLAFSGSAGVVRVNVTQLVQQWQETKPKHNIQFLVRVRRNAERIAFAKGSEGDRAQLFLVTTMESSPETMEEDMRAESTRQLQRVEIMAAWDTLDKVTENWKFNYRPPNALSDELIPLVQELPKADARLTQDTGRRNKALTPVVKDAALEESTAAILQEALNRSRPHSAVDQREVWKTQSPTTASRKKRKAATKRSLAEQSRMDCHLEPLPISMTELGWNNWVVAPESFDIGYCIGVCPWPMAAFKPSLHAVMQGLISFRKSGEVPSAACVPTKIGSMKMMFYDDDLSLVSHNYGRMIATECGCR